MSSLGIKRTWAKEWAPKQTRTSVPDNAAYGIDGTKEPEKVIACACCGDLMKTETGYFSTELFSPNGVEPYLIDKKCFSKEIDRALGFYDRGNVRALMPFVMPEMRYDYIHGLRQPDKDTLLNGLYREPEDFEG